MKVGACIQRGIPPGSFVTFLMALSRSFMTLPDGPLRKPCKTASTAGREIQPNRYGRKDLHPKTHVARVP